MVQRTPHARAHLPGRSVGEGWVPEDLLGLTCILTW